MNRARLPAHAVIDGFLPDDAAQALLDHAIASRDAFQPAIVARDGARYADDADRRAMTNPDLGPARCAFTAAVEAHAEHLCRQVGLAPFPVVAWDIELAAHRDGGYFHEHIDTMTAANRSGQPGDRVISIVYYLHRPEARFSGGELVLRPFDRSGQEIRITPRHNRLVAFPSFARHEVATVHVPGDGWEDARFSINCWLLRGREDR